MIHSRHCQRTILAVISLASLGIACFGPAKTERSPGNQTPQGFPDVWAAAPSADPRDTKNGASTASPYYEPESRTVRATAAVGETAGFQIVLEGGRRGAYNLNIGAEAFSAAGATIPRENIRLYRQYPVRVERFPNWYFLSVGHRRPRDIPDVLVPLDAPQHGHPINIEPGESVVLWCDVDVPPSAQPGEFAGALIIQTADGATRRIPVALSVRNLGIAGVPSLPVVARVQIRPLLSTATKLDVENTRQVLESPDAKKAIYDAFRLLHAHGLSPMTADIKPPFRQEIDGRAVIDWSGYDSLFGPLIDGTAYGAAQPAAAWPLPIDETYPDPAAYGGRASATYNAIVKEYMTACLEHFRHRGWDKQAFVYFDIPKTENPTQKEAEEVRQLATLTHLVSPDLAFATRLAPQSMEQFGWHDQSHVDLKPIVDIWATPARYDHPPTLKKLQTLGKRTWFYPDNPPYSGSLAIEAPLVQARSLPAQAFLLNHGAMIVQKTTDWPKAVVESPIEDDDQASDSWLIYPGEPFGLSEPVPSMRLKELQQGLGDYRRMQQLDKRGRGETAKLVSRSLIKAAGTETYGNNYQDPLLNRRVDDPEAWDLARRILDDELDAVMHGVEPEELAAGAGRGKWSKLLIITRRIEAWFEGARLELKTRGEKSQYVLSYDLAVRNDLTQPLTGEVNFGQIPPEARRISDTVTIGPIKPYEMGRGSIVMATPVLPDTTIDGHVPQEIIYDAGTSGTVSIPAAASIAQVVTLADRPTVDGKLDEWPPASVNAAGDFRLITGGLAPGRDRKKPKSQTIVYFGRYDDTLYVALAAEAPESDGRPKTTLRNFVEYRNLIPVGEDLIEIMIDPTNRGVLPGDLFHLIVKSSGNPKFERGIDMTPPIGDVGPWPGSQPECTVRQTGDGWAAELAIPIAAFGEDATQNRIWGLNVARLEPVRGEYSDWARAPRYCYDPRTLGNLVWAE